MGDPEPRLGWSVHVVSATQPEFGGMNFGSGATPEEALTDLRRKWHEGEERYAAAVALLDRAVAESLGDRGRPPEAFSAAHD